MKIVNETVYDSDDLYNLFIEVNDACDRALESQAKKIAADARAKGKVWVRSEYYYEKPLPSTVRIGYCKPMDVDFTTLRSRYSDVPRIGIVRPADLPINPLVVLAQCAEDAKREVPSEVVGHIAKSFARTRRGQLKEEVLKEILEDVRVTFSLKEKPAAVEEAKRARKAAQVERLRDKVAWCDRDIRKMEARLASLRDERAKYQSRLDRLVPNPNPKEEMCLRV